MGLVSYSNSSISIKIFLSKIMADEGVTITVDIALPHPWPPTEARLLVKSDANGLDAEVVALTDGRITVSWGDPQPRFISQPVQIKSDGQMFAPLAVALSQTETRVFLGFDLLKEDAPDVSPLIIDLSNEPTFTIQLSTDHPDRATICQTWIQNRKKKFATPAIARDDRRLKTPRNWETTLSLPFID
jgi:hypothetical protein